MSQKYLPSTSRDLDPTNYAWDSIVYQAGRPMLDSELNLTQDVLKAKNTLPSGVLSYQGQDDSVGSFVFEVPYDNSGNLNANFTANGFSINPFKAIVNGMVIDVRKTNVANALDNVNNIVLPAPGTGPGAGDRGDFVFLEVWRREVTPSMSAKSRIRIVSPSAASFLRFKKNGVIVELNAVLAAPVGVDQFLKGNSNAETARNLAEAINNRDGANAGLTVDGVKTIAETRGTEFVFLTHDNGSNGNFDIAVPASFTVESDMTGVRVIDRPAGGSDGEGMTSANKIYFNGNVLAPASTDLDDNIQDPNVSVSSTRRIQVQYRIRSFSNTDLSQQIFGFENTSVLAQGSQGSPVGGYTFSRHDTDTGLWYAGNGSEAHATALGTVDGYVYAIPLCYVFRRNSQSGVNGFSPLGSFNTGVLHDHASTLGGNDYVDGAALKESDRPDGLFADQIAEQDILDLRRKVYPRGIDLAAELDYQYHSLLDGTNKTWFAKAHNIQTTGNGSGGASHTPLVCDVYGREAFNNGNVGEWRQHFDHIARRWTNEPTTERAFVAIQPENSAQISTGVTCTKAVGTAGTFWHEGDVITIDVTALKVSSGLLWADAGNNLFNNASNNNNPPKLIDIGHIWHDDGHFVNKINQQVKVKSITGLGTNTVEITLLRNTQVANGGVQNALDYILTGYTGNVADDGAAGGSRRRIFIELIFDYCSFDRGLSGVAVEVPTPDESSHPTGPAILINDPPAGALTPFYAGKGNSNPPPISNIIPNTKEVSLECVFTKTTDEFVSSDELGVYLPWRVYYNPDQIDGATDNVIVTDQSGVGTSMTFSENLSKFQHSESKVGFTGVGWVSGQRKISVSAYPLEAYPADDTTDSQILVYYRRSAPKTVGADFPISTTIVNSSANPGGVVPDELKLKPLSVGKDIQVFLKTHEHYPFFNPTDDFATHFNAEALTYKEYEELSSPEVILDDLKINTGSVSLPSFVPFVTSVNITLGDTAVNQVPRKDTQGRAYYPTMEDTSYFPSAFAKSMSGYHRNYKTVIPCLMKVVDDNHILYRKGEVVLVTFVKTTSWGQGVSVDMREESLTDNFVAACVYRTRNQLLLGE